MLKEILGVADDPPAKRRWFPRFPGGGVLGEHGNGGLCEYIAVDARQLIEIPDGVSFKEAAALPIAYGT